MVLIPPGEFLMGSPASEVDREGNETQHRVKITKPFCLGSTEVTQGQWKAVMGTEPWKAANLSWLLATPEPAWWVSAKGVREGSEYPATYVSWEDAAEFCKKLSVKEGKEYRLPSEAQWEYACRAGTTTPYSFGDDFSSSDNDTTRLSDYAWFEKNALAVNEEYAHLVGTKRPNPWGLYDLHGNSLEWCVDWYGDFDGSQAENPIGPVTGSDRVIRSGTWFNAARFCRSAFRAGASPSLRNFDLGFRCVQVLDVSSVASPSTAPGSVDLLPLVELPRDVIHGNWTKTNGVLIGTNYKSCIQIPYTPPEEYDLVISGRVLSKSQTCGLVIGMVSQNRQFCFRLGSLICTLGGLNKYTQKFRPFPDGATNDPMPPLSEKFTLVCAVRKGSLRMSIGDRTLLSFQDDFSLLPEVPEPYRIPRKDRLFITVANHHWPGTTESANVSWEITSLSLKPVAAPMRQAVPDVQAREAASQLLKEVYKDDYAGARLPDKKAAVAQKLLQQAKQSAESVERYVLLSEARNFAVDGNDPQALQQVLREIVNDFDVDAATIFTEAWKAFLTKPRPTSVMRFLYDEATVLFDDAVVRAAFDDAKRYSDFIVSIAPRLGDAAIHKLSRDRANALTTRTEEWTAVQSAVEKLKTNPDDADANFIVGRYRAVVEHDWPTALPLLAKGGDSPWKDLAASSLIIEADDAAQTDLADAWWDAAQSAKPEQKLELTAAALHWYQVVLPTNNGLQKMQIERRIAEATAMVVPHIIPPTKLAGGSANIPAQIPKAPTLSSAATIAPPAPPDLSTVNLTGVWKSLATDNYFYVRDTESGITVSLQSSGTMSALDGALARKGAELESSSWVCVFKKDPSKQSRQGSFVGKITSPNRIEAKFPHFNWDAKGNIDVPDRS